MSAKDLLERIRSATGSGADMGLTEIREEIHAEFKEATTAEERSTILHIYKVVMDGVERQIPSTDLENFQTARRQDYNLLIVSECVIDDDVSLPLLDAVTRREIAAGRMAADHELRQLSDAHAAADLKPPPGSPRKGWREALRWRLKSR